MLKPSGKNLIFYDFYHKNKLESDIISSSKTKFTTFPMAHFTPISDGFGRTMIIAGSDPYTTSNIGVVMEREELTQLVR